MLAQNMSRPKLLSDTIEILMGEWLIYKAIDLYRRGPYSCDIDSNYKTVPNEALFSSLEFHPSSCWFLSSVYSQLIDLRLLQPVKKSDSNSLIAGCKYRDIKSTVSNNLSKLGRSSVHYIFNEEDVPLAANKPFTIEDGCAPMMDAFETKGYVVRYNKTYSWENKFSELFGARGLPKADDQTEFFEIIKMELDQNITIALKKLAAENQKIVAVDVIRKSLNITLKEAKTFLEDYMFPHIWGQQKPGYTLKWYKENRQKRNWAE